MTAIPTTGSDIGSDVVGGLLALTRADLAACSGDQLVELAEVSQAVRNYLDGFDVRLTRAAARSRETTTADVFVRRGTAATNRNYDRAETADRIPEMGAALEAGEISGAHVDALTRASKNLDDRTRERLADRGDSLADAARTQTPEQFGYTARDLVARLSDEAAVDRNEQLRRRRCLKRWTDVETGARKTLFVLDPENDARLWATINALTAAARQQPQPAELTFDQLQVDAVLTHLCDRATTGVAPAATRNGRPIDAYLRRVPQVSVLIDLDTLLEGLSESSTCEYVDGTPLPVATVRRLCCEAKILPVVLDGDGVAVDVGREQRVATAAHRRALEAMYATCSHPDCHVPFDRCEVHHVTPWERGGTTCLDNLTPACNQHHHALHEGGWALELRADRRMIWRRPDGSIYFQGSTVDRRRRTPTPSAA
jgi:hypothetical protein